MCCNTNLVWDRTLFGHVNCHRWINCLRFQLFLICRECVWCQTPQCLNGLQFSVSSCLYTNCSGHILVKFSVLAPGRTPFYWFLTSSVTLSWNAIDSMSCIRVVTWFSILLFYAFLIVSEIVGRSRNGKACALILAQEVQACHECNNSFQIWSNE